MAPLDEVGSSASMATAATSILEKAVLVGPKPVIGWLRETRRETYSLPEFMDFKLFGKTVVVALRNQVYEFLGYLVGHGFLPIAWDILGLPGYAQRNAFFVEISFGWLGFGGRQAK